MRESVAFDMDINSTCLKVKTVVSRELLSESISSVIEKWQSLLLRPAKLITWAGYSTV